jgi:hypothetical protein
VPTGLSVRAVRPEVLDSLPPVDREALRSRRDLARINRLMFHASILARLLRQSFSRPPGRLLEVGAGDGGLMLAVARKLARHWPAVEVTLLDRAEAGADRRRDAFAKLGWRATIVTEDVFAWLAGCDDRFDGAVANLFLHHFTEPELRTLLAAIHRVAPVLVAAEPHRNAFALGMSKLLWCIGANAVTLHDAAASVAAGFRDRELSALWPAECPGTLRERRVGPFTQAFSAVVMPHEAAHAV